MTTCKMIVWEFVFYVLNNGWKSDRNYHGALSFALNAVAQNSLLQLLCNFHPCQAPLPDCKILWSRLVARSPLLKLVFILHVVSRNISLLANKQRPRYLDSTSCLLRLCRFFAQARPSIFCIMFAKICRSKQTCLHLMQVNFWASACMYA